MLNYAGLGPIANTLRKIFENYVRFYINNKYIITSINKNILYSIYLLFQNGWGNEKSEMLFTFNFNGPNLLKLGIKELLNNKLEAFN